MKRSNRFKLNIAFKDDVIGSTVYLLCMYGYSLRDSGDRHGLLAIVSQLAADILDRTDPNGRPLSTDRIEQIYEEFQARNEDRAFKIVPSRYTKKSRRALKPGDAPETLAALAEILIRNDGQYPGDDAFPVTTDPQLTDGAIEELAGAPMTKSMRKRHDAEMRRITQKRRPGRPKKI